MLLNNWEIVTFDQVKNSPLGKAKFLADFTQLPGQCRPPLLHANLLPPSTLQDFLLLGVDKFQAQFFLIYEKSADHYLRPPWASIGISSAPLDPTCGLFHFFEMNFLENAQLAQEAALTLLAFAQTQLQAQGKKKIIGPLTYHTWFSYRYLLAAGGTQSYYQWEPANPPEYPQLFLENGFTIQQKYHTRANGKVANFLAATKIHYQTACAKGYRFCPIGENLTALYRLSMEGMANNYLFSPISFEQFSALYVPLIKKYNSSSSYFALDTQGQEVGLFLIFPDHQAIVLKTVTVNPAHRGQGLSNALLYLGIHGLVMQYGEKYFTEVISALMIDQAQSESYSKYGPLLWERQYGLLGKELPSG